MLDFLKIGQIVKPQGVGGQVKVVPLTDDINRYNGLNQVYIDGKPYKVKCKIAYDCVYVLIDGVFDRNTAETFRNKFLCVSRENAVPLSGNTFFIADIIGLNVIFENGKTFGKIIDVQSAKTDVFTVKTVEGKTVCFPFLKEYLIEVSVKEQKFIVKEADFNKVVCYED